MLSCFPALLSFHTLLLHSSTQLKTCASRYKQHDPPLWPFWEITLFGLFHSRLYDTLAALHKDKIYVDPSTGKKPQQTYADKEKQIANELANLKPHHAHIKLTSGEYILKTKRS